MQHVLYRICTISDGNLTFEGPFAILKKIGEGSMKNTALQIVKDLKNAGFSAFLVGGCVRDFVLGNTPKDFDVTTSATPKQVAEVFPEMTSIVGAAFAVSLVKMNGFTFEVATFRKEVYFSDGDNRHPDQVTLVTNVVEDLARRDFTFSAMLMDEDEQVIDYFNGLSDIQNKVVRAVGNANTRFNEDALRMLRAIRFASRFGFEIEQNTFEAIRNNAHLIQNISMERINSELSKMLTSGNPTKAITLLVNSELMKYLVPEFLDLIACEQDKEHHPEGSVFNHVMKMLTFIPKDASLSLVLSVLFHDISKPETRVVHENGKISFHRHENVGAVKTKTILQRLKFDNETVETVVSNVFNHMKFFCAKDMKTSTLVKFVKTSNFSELLELGRADCLGSSGNLSDIEFVEGFIATQLPLIESKPFLKGNDLIKMGLKPSAAFKTILETVENRRLEGDIKTFDEACTFALHMGKSMGVYDHKG